MESATDKRRQAGVAAGLPHGPPSRVRFVAQCGAVRWVMVRRRLPIGMQTFRELREQDCYYVDKTHFIQCLLDEGKHYFLSRPRRFGKSLFLDTLGELFEGSEELFAGLHIHARDDWSQRHPVVRLSFGGGRFTGTDVLEANVMEQLGAAERRLGWNRST